MTAASRPASPGRASPASPPEAQTAALPSHSVPPAVMQMMAKVKVARKSSTEAEAAGTPGAGQDETERPRKRSHTSGGASLPTADVAMGAEPERRQPKHDEYVVALDMTGRSGLGLDVDWADGKTLFIKAVKAEGAIADWNRSRPGSEQVQRGDRIVAINDCTDNADAMLSECRTKHQLHLVVRTPREPPPRGDADPLGQGQGRRIVEFPIELDMAAAKSGLGLDVDWADGKTLLIKAVKAEGAIRSWNQTCSQDKALQVGDRLVAVNGKSGDPKAMLGECRSRGQLRLLIRREAPVDTKAAVPLTGAQAHPQEPAVAAAAAAGLLSPARSHEFFAWADMTRNSFMGLDVNWDDGKTLFVNSVQPGGAVQEWNLAHAIHEQVTAGDRVVAVNGYSDDPAAMAELCRELISSRRQIQLRCRGPPPPPPIPPGGPPVPKAEDSEEKNKKREKKDRKVKEAVEKDDSDVEADKKDEKKKKKDEKKDKDEKKEKKEKGEKKDK